MKAIKFSLFFIMLALFVACNDDDDNDSLPDNDEEEITTVIVTVDSGNAPATSFRYRIDEGNVVEQDQIQLMSGQMYDVNVRFLNEEEVPAEEVTEEIEEEDNEHLICFTTSSVFLNVTYDDADENGLPVGLETNWEAGATGGTGEITVTLRHQPDLKETQSDANCNIGETDIQATFPVTIQ